MTSDHDRHDGTDPLTGESQISLTRVIEADVADVFAAWTDPALVEQWQADTAEIEPYEGGQYRLVTEIDPDEDDPGAPTQFVVFGEYLQYAEDERLVMSFIVEGAGEGGDDLIFVLDIAFGALSGGRTRLTLIERGATHADAQSRIFSMEAWSEAIAHLAELLE